MQSGSDPALLKDMYSKLMLMFNLKDVGLGNLRGYSLHLLKKRGVFETTLSRYRRPNGFLTSRAFVTCSFRTKRSPRSSGVLSRSSHT